MKKHPEAGRFSDDLEMKKHPEAADI